MTSSTIAAARRLVADLRDELTQFDANLAGFEQAERQGEPVLPALAAAQVLVALSRLHDELSERAEALEVYIEDLPAHTPNDGAASVEDR